MDWSRIALICNKQMQCAKYKQSTFLSKYVTIPVVDILVIFTTYRNYEFRFRPVSHWRPIWFDSRSQTRWLHWFEWCFSHLIVVGYLVVRHKFWSHHPASCRTTNLVARPLDWTQKNGPFHITRLISSDCKQCRLQKFCVCSSLLEVQPIPGVLNRGPLHFNQGATDILCFSSLQYISRIKALPHLDVGHAYRKATQNQRRPFFDLSFVDRQCSIECTLHFRFRFLIFFRYLKIRATSAAAAASSSTAIFSTCSCTNLVASVKRALFDRTTAKIWRRSKVVPVSSGA